MDFHLFIFLTAIAVIFLVMGFRSTTFAVIGALTFIMLAILTLKENLTMTYYFYDSNTSKVVSKVVTMLDGPMNIFLPLAYFFIGIGGIFVRVRRKEGGGFVYG